MQSSPGLARWTPTIIALLGALFVAGAFELGVGSLAVVGGVLLLAAAVVRAVRHDRGVAARIAAEHAELVSRFGEDVVKRIKAREIWQGATPDMIRLSLGEPIAVDEKVLKTKTKQTWKYEQRSAASFGLRVFFEDDVVVGWERK